MAFFYTLGRMFTYTALGLLFFFGASQFKIASALQGIGVIWLGIALLLIGIFMLDIIKLNIPGVGNLTEKFSNKKKGRKPTGMHFYWDCCSLWRSVPIAGCSISGGIDPHDDCLHIGTHIPPVFALATGLPVIIIAWLLAYSVSNIGTFYKKMNSFQEWFKRGGVAAVFMVVGAYYIIISL